MSTMYLILFIWNWT